MVYTVVKKSAEPETSSPSGGGVQAQSQSGEGFWNLDLELQAVKTILNPTSKWATKLYSSCKPNYFHHSATKSIFVRVQAMLASSETFELPTLNFVLSDSTVSPTVKETLRDAFEGDDVAEVNSQGDFDLLISGLSNLAKTRALYQVTHKAANELLDSESPSELIKAVSNQLGTSLFQLDDDDGGIISQVTMGKGYNQSAEDSFNRILNGTFEDVKIKTGFREFDEKTGGFHKTNLVIMGANSGGGKCNKFNTLVPSSLGIQKIGDLYNQFSQPTDSGWVPVPEGGLSVHTREGVKPVDGVYKTEGTCHEITTKWGDWFEGLGEHKLYCYDNLTRKFDFKRLDQIQESDWILKAVDTQMFGENKQLPDFEHGDVKSAERFIPKCIMEAPKNIQCAFLKTLYEGDGSIYEVNKGGKKGKDSKVWSLEYSSISKQLVRDVKALLENMGVYCRVKTKDTWASNGSENQVAKTGYTLYILRESYESFQQIGFMSERKSKELSRCIDHCKMMTEAGNPNYLGSGLYNRIPNAPVIAYIDRVFELMKGQRITVHGTSHGKPTEYEAPVGKYHIFYPNNCVRKVLASTKGYTSKYTANLIIKSHFGYSTKNRLTGEDTPIDPHIREIVENDPVLVGLRKEIDLLCSQVWTKVSSTEEKDEVVDVYDLSVPGPHEYAANGLVSHNSLMAVNLLIRQYRMGYNTVLCSYEMTDDEVMIRVLSNISEVDMNDIQNNKLNPTESDRVSAAWREFNLLGHNQGNSYNILCPKTETSVPEIGFRVRGMKPDVLILDYINLLTSSTGADDAHWLQLGNIAREAKLLANKLECVVILLAQIDEQYNLRYSKAIKDHANFMMGWVRDEPAITTRLIQIRQQKARNAPLYAFDLLERFDIAQFRDPEQEDRISWPSKEDLVRLELECQSKGLMLEPTVSKEFDKKKEEERLNVKLESPKEEKVDEVLIESIEDSVVVDDEDEEAEEAEERSFKSQPSDLLFSEDDIMLQDFSTLPVKSSSVSLLKNNPLYEDTV